MFLSSDLIELIHVDGQLLFEAWEFFKLHNDKRFSLTDCISFLVMKEREIASALSFDKHFIQAGFKRLPK
jgi:predicted nucleic acid-binding protein